MGIFTRKTEEQKQAELQAKLEKAQAQVAREQKFTDKERARADKATMKHKIALAKRTVDAAAADSILLLQTDGDTMQFLCTMPDAVMVYEVATLGTWGSKLKGTDTIPYKSVNSVQHEKQGLVEERLTLVTSGETYEFKTHDYARFTAEVINERRR